MTADAELWDRELMELAPRAPLLQTWGWGEVQSRAGWSRGHAERARREAARVGCVGRAARARPRARRSADLWRGRAGEGWRSSSTSRRRLKRCAATGRREDSRGQWEEHTSELRSLR